MSQEVFGGARFVYSRLSALGTLPVHAMPAPQDAEPPFYAFDVALESYFTTMNGRIVWSPQEWTPRIVGEGDSILPLQTHVEAIRTALHLKAGEVLEGGWEVVSSRVVAPLRLPPYYVNGKRRYEIGERVRVLVRRRE